jgi:hypothetical protein
MVESAKLVRCGVVVFEIAVDCLFKHLLVSGAMVGRKVSGENRLC